VIIRYKAFEREEALKFDVLVNECVLVKAKTKTFEQEATEKTEQSGLR
jgi:hypothetical protein